MSEFCIISTAEELNNEAIDLGTRANDALHELWKHVKSLGSDEDRERTEELIGELQLQIDDLRGSTDSMQEHISYAEGVAREELENREESGKEAVKESIAEAVSDAVPDLLAQAFDYALGKPRKDMLCPLQVDDPCEYHVRYREYAERCDAACLPDLVDPDWLEYE